MNSPVNHESVLLQESLNLLALQPGDRMLDVTLGLAGHASAFTEDIGTTGEFVGLDADTDNLIIAKQKLEQAAPKCIFYHVNFRNLSQLDLGTFDAIFADLGVSSPHFDDSSRGFSFRFEGPLDMRLDRTSGQTAADFIANASENDLADALFQYGEIKQSRKLSVALKAVGPQTTLELKDICDEFFGFKSSSLLPQIFQALRIAVNDEMSALKNLLHIAPSMLNTGGRLGIIAFHSLEDRMVKRYFKEITTPEIDDMTGATTVEAPYALLGRKAIKPTDEELQKNPRARSARLRGIIRV